MDRPDRELRAFAKVTLEAGTSASVHLTLDDRSFAFYDAGDRRWRVEGGAYEILLGASSRDIRHRVTVEIDGERLGASSGTPGSDRDRFVADDDRFASMLGHPIPDPTPVLPFTLNTVVEELDATRLGRITQRGFLRIADRQSAQLLGDDPDPVLRMLSRRMIREAPLRFLVSISGGAGSVKAFEGLTKMLSALRITGRRRS